MARCRRSLSLFSGVVLAITVLYFFVRRPYSDTARQGEEEWVRFADGEVKSVGLLAYAESTERQSSVLDSSVESDARMSFEPRVPSQSSTTTVNSEATTGKPVSPLSINLVIVMFTSTSNESKLHLREQEHATVLQSNLKHPMISSLHVITADKNGMEEYFRGLDLQNRHKLVVVESKQWDTMRGVFQYISDTLTNKDVMYANGDIYLGNGFEKVDANVLSKRNVFYALSRLGKQEEKCKMPDYCGGDFQYIGAHDVFLFHLKEALSEQVLKELEFKIWDYGAENVLIGVFQKLLHYCTLNPCKILESYHLHCSGAHHGNRTRINTNTTFNGLSPFTTNLTCQPSLEHSTDA